MKALNVLGEICCSDYHSFHVGCSDFNLDMILGACPLWDPLE